MILLKSFMDAIRVSSIIIRAGTSFLFEIKPEDLIGKQITVKIQNQHARVFNGFVKSFSFGEVKSSGFREYNLVMVPWLWFLSKQFPQPHCDHV